MKRVLFGIIVFVVCAFVNWYGGVEWFVRGFTNACWLFVDLLIGILAATCPAEFLNND